MNIFKKLFFLLFLCYIEPTCQKKKDCRSTGVACGQYKDKEGKNRQKLFNWPWNVNFLFPFVPRNYYTKNRIQRQKMWAGWYRLKLHQSSGIRNRAMMLLCRDFLDACRKKNTMTLYLVDLKIPYAKQTT